MPLTEIMHQVVRYVYTHFGIGFYQKKLLEQPQCPENYTITESSVQEQEKTVHASIYLPHNPFSHFAPALISSSITLVWPFSVANIKAVLPFWALAFTSAPLANNVCTISL
jgi:hypothetical protein